MDTVKLKIERLKELQIAKQVMILNQAVAEHDGYSQKGDQDFAEAVDVVIPLIDAEIARQSVTDCSTCIGCVSESQEGGMIKNCPQHIRRIQPTDKTVREAIALLDETVPIDESDAKYRGAVKTIKKALRQIKPVEPCCICGNIKTMIDYFPDVYHPYQLVRTGDGVYLIALGKVSKDGGGVNYRYSPSITNCPSCGRKLKDGE